MDVSLVRFGFDTGWINWVMECVRSVTFVVFVNEKPSADFRPGRGLRRGDSISSYLFILSAEIFSHLLRKAEERETLKGIRLAPTAPSVNHLLFADDCIILSSASMQDTEAIQ